MIRVALIGLLLACWSTKESDAFSSTHGATDGYVTGSPGYCGSKNNPLWQYGTSGRITSPYYPSNYPSGSSCAWRISAPFGSRVRLQFTELCTEGCCDIVVAFDGYSSGSRQLFSESGCRTPSTTWLSSGNYVFVVFSSDGTVTERGFDLRWYTDGLTTEAPVSQPWPSVQPTAEYCGSRFNPMLIRGYRGRITSPNYPNNYPNYADCAWRIQSYFRRRLVLRFLDFCTENSYDVLSVFNGPSDSSSRLLAWSGCNRPSTISSSGEYLFITFRADGSSTRRGFEIEWADEYNIGTVAPPGFTTAGYGELTTAAGEYCGSPSSPINYYSSSGNVRSPNYPNYYPNNANCGWRINAGSGQVVRLQLQYLCTEACCDKVRIYDGGYTWNPLLDEHSGCSHWSNVTITSGNTALVTFTSDGSQRNVGFSLYWNFYYQGTGTELPGANTTSYTPYCGTPDNPIHYYYSPSYTGVITSPNYPSAYPDRMNCAWRIQAYSGYSVYANVNYLCTESCCDFLNMHDGSSRFSNQIFRRSGCFGNTFYVRSNYNYLYISFTSDGSVSNAGFTLSWGYRYGYNQGTGQVTGLPMTSAVPTSGYYCGSPSSPIYVSSPSNRGTIRSPYYPSNYPNYANCGWLVYVPPGQVVTAIFNDICTETCCDHVRFYDGQYTSSRLIRSVSSCNPMSDPIVSTGNWMLITFTSDGSVTQRGFQIEWSVGRSCPPNFVSLGGTCYYFMLQPMNWFQAEKYCTTFRPRDYDVHLAGFETPGEWSLVRSYIRNSQTHRSRGFWTSGSRIDVLRGWQWSATKVTLNYNAWAGNGPSGNGNCVQLWASQEHRFDDTNCENGDIYAVCEYQAELDTNSTMFPMTE